MSTIRKNDFFRPISEIEESEQLRFFATNSPEPDFNPVSIVVHKRDLVENQKMRKVVERGMLVVRVPSSGAMKGVFIDNKIYWFAPYNVFGAGSTMVEDAIRKRKLVREFIIDISEFQLDYESQENAIYNNHSRL